jgi:hypothetical protein
VDFGIWVLRNALPPRRPKTWLAAGLFVAGLAGVALLPTHRGAFIAVTAVLAGLLTVMLMLSYFRTMMSVHVAELGQNQDRLSEKFARGQGAFGVANAVTGSVAISDEAAETAFAHLLESDLMDALVKELDTLRLRVDRIEHDAVTADDLATLKAELRSLARRTDWRLRTDAEAITYISERGDHAPSAH